MQTNLISMIVAAGAIYILDYIIMIYLFTMLFHVTNREYMSRYFITSWNRNKYPHMNLVGNFIIWFGFLFGMISPTYVYIHKAVLFLLIILRLLAAANDTDDRKRRKKCFGIMIFMISLLVLTMSGSALFASYKIRMGKTDDVEKLISLFIGK